MVDNTINDDRYHKGLSRGRAASRDAEPSVSKALLQALSTREAASPDAKELFNFSTFQLPILRRNGVLSPRFPVVAHAEILSAPKSHFAPLDFAAAFSL